MTQSPGTNQLEETRNLLKPLFGGVFLILGGNARLSRSHLS